MGRRLFTTVLFWTLAKHSHDNFAHSPQPQARTGIAPESAAWTSHPDGRFHLRIADKTRVTQYRFGTKTADFHVCLTCGAIPIVTCMIEGIRYAVFNVNTFDDVDRSEFVETATNFEGETTENRLARRRRNWTPENIRNGGAKLR